MGITKGKYFKGTKSTRTKKWTLEESLKFAMSFVAPKRVRDIRTFAESEVRLPKGPRRGMMFQVDFMPLTGFILDAMEDPYWKKVAIVGPTQNGKSLVGTNIPTLHIVCELEENVIFGLPNMELASGMWKEKIKPVIQYSKYSDLLPTSGAGSKGGMVSAITLNNGVVVRFMGAGGSPEQMSSHTAKFIIMTEIDKMDDVSEGSDETDPVSLIENRADSFEDGKIIMECTVTTEEGRIWQEAMVIGSGSRPFVPCPECGKYQPLVKEQLRFDTKDDLAAEKSARYECIECKYMWDDLDRRQALNKPILVHKGQDVDEDGNVIGDMPRTRNFGIHYNVLYSPMQSLGKTAVQQLQADNSVGIAKKKGMQQSKWAEPWKNDLVTAEITYKYLKQQSDLSEVPLVLVPDWAENIVLTADLQKDRLYWMVKAFKRDHTNQIVDYGVINYTDPSDSGMRDGLNELRSLSENGWRRISDFDEILLPSVNLVDSRYKPHVVYDWMKGKSKWYPIKGVGQRLSKKMDPGEALFRVQDVLEIRRLSKQAKEYEGTIVWFIHVDETKGMVHDRILLDQDAPGHTIIPNDLSKNIMIHLTAEKRVYNEKTQKEIWQIAPGRRRNDWLDCDSYAAAANFYLVAKDQRAEKKDQLASERNKRINRGEESPRKSLLGSSGYGQKNWITQRGRS